MPRKPRVLVVSAHAGEPQRPTAEAMLARQVGVSVEQAWIEGLGLDEAMGRAHELSRDADADWVLKLDGDMVPLGVDSLRRIVDAATRNGYDRLTTPVLDAFTGKQMSGVHLMRPSRVARERLIVAHRPDAWITQVTGTTWRRVVWPQVLHAPNPDVAQALRFGLQRGTKARLDGAASAHWSTMIDLARQARAHPTPALTCALFGAWVGLGLEPSIGDCPRTIVNRADPAFQELLARCQRTVPSHVLCHASLRGVISWHRAIHGDDRAAATALARYLNRRVRPWAWPPPRRL